MKKTLARFKTWCHLQSERFQAFIADCFQSKKKTFIFLGLFVFTVLFFIEVGIILINNSFYTNFSDDILQYYTIAVDYVAQIKAGTVSFFNLNNYFGASLYSDIYYLPIDIFTGITFILSYVMPTELAYSITELIKIWAGVMIFAYYLHLNHMKPRTIFWMGIIYFISGGSVSFMAFPAFLSLAFYLPLGLVVIHWFMNGKKWVVPLYVLALIFYDFYLGYSAIAFVSIMYLVESAKRGPFNFFKYLKDGFIFLCLILLGVMMSTVILYPSILFILEQTYRPENTFNGWVVPIFGHEVKLFQPTIYIRIFAKIFVEQKPIGFYGFENHYGLEHFSLFISVVGFIYMSYIFFMKDKIARIYKVTILAGIIMMIFPIFSYVFSGTTDVPYTRWINMLPLVEIMILAHVFDRYGFEEVKMKWLTIPIVGLLGILGYTIYYYIIKLSEDVKYSSRDVMTADTALMGVAGVFLILILVFGWLKKHKWIKRIFWLEFIIAIVYIYTGPFSIRNKINTFAEMDRISEFLQDNLTQDEFYRVFVDFQSFDVEDINFNRMTPFATNTEIFHSWTDKETNDISWLLYGANEYQSKKRMNNQSIYLNHFLGYRYLLVAPEQGEMLPEDYYTLISQTDQYALFEINNSESFQVYESSMSYTRFFSMSEASKEKILLMAVLIDQERYPALDVELAYQTSPLSQSYKSASAYSSLLYSDADLVERTGVIDAETQKEFYRFTTDDLAIGFESGAAYIRTRHGVDALTSEDYGEVFMEFSDGSLRACEIIDDEESKHQVKCEFWMEPQAIYFEKNASIDETNVTEMRLERAIEGAAYLVYPLTNMPEQGLISMKMGSLTIERSFVVDAEGNQTECMTTQCYLSSQPVRIYVYKTGDMYSTSDLFSLKFQYLADDLSFYEENAVSKISDNQQLSINNGKIELSYTRTSDTAYDQIVMIPVAYSEEWVITSETYYETLSVSGGFLGIIIPNGENEIHVTMEFQPAGLIDGLKTSVAGFLIYAVIFLPVLLDHYKKRLQRKLLKPEEITHEDLDHHRSSL